MLWIDFVNSQARDPLGRGRDEDRLADPAWMQQLADKWHLRPLPARGQQQLAALRKFRALLVRCVQPLIERQPLDERDIRALNRQLNNSPVRPRLTAQGGTFRLDLQPTATGVDRFLFAVAASFARFLVECDVSRLKTCDNPDCAWVFYDATRSRTRRWCAVGCGDLIKVREFRARQKSTPRKSRAQRRTP